MNNSFNWTRTFEFPCWKSVTCYQSYNYERFDWRRFYETLNVFCKRHKIKRRNISFSPPSPTGTWYYHYEVKCTEFVFEELKKHIDETLREMNV